MKKVLLVVLLMILASAATFFYFFTKSGETPLDVVKKVVDIPDIIEKALTGGDSLNILINEDANAEVPLAFFGPEGESLVVLESQPGRDHKFSEMIVTNTAGKTASIKIDLDGLVSTLTDGESIVSYSNYRETMVDISIERADGTIEVLKDQPVNIKTLNVAQANPLPFVNSAHAAAPTINNPAGDAADTPADLVGSTYKAYSFAMCGASLSLLIPSFGGSATLGLLSCGSVAVNVIIDVLPLDPCLTAQDKKDRKMQCIVDGFRESLATVTGPSVKGVLSDADTDKDISRAEIIVLRKSGSHKHTSKSFFNGLYYLGNYTEQGSYTATIKKDKYVTRKLAIIVSHNRIVITEDGSNILDKKYKYSGERISFPLNLKLTPEKVAADIYDGRWEGTSTFKSASVPDPSEPGETIECATTNWAWNINDSQINGSALVDEDYNVNLKGSVDDRGVVNVGVGAGEFITVDFQGTLNAENNTVKGTWDSNTGCSGDFSGNRK